LQPARCQRRIAVDAMRLVRAIRPGQLQSGTEKTMSLSNSLGLLGRKVGMMRLFTEDGDAVPVTVIDVSNNRVAQVKTQAVDGYDALQVAFGKRRASRVTKPMAGHYAKAGVEAGQILRGISCQR
jgi:hypothetical protein